ncbi:MAG TPA: hypothetical protein VIY69_11335 [Candidatus Acidoferrales bacterium]
MSREPESIARKVLKVALLVLLLPVVLVLRLLSNAVVYALVWVLWLPKGKNVLYVSSDSPIWKEYMETEVFPLVANRAIVLNWSARSEWPHWSLAVRVFRTFGQRRDFNPMVIVFRPFQRAKVFRFFAAFGEWKDGNTAPIERLHRDLTHAL